MAVGVYTYGSVARVQSLVGDVVASRTFGTGTVPTLVEVELFLDDIASQIHAAMAEGGYTVPTAAVLTTSAPRAAGWLGMLNSLGACALVLQSLPYEAQAAALPDAPPSRGNWFQRRFEDGLKRIAEGNFLATLGLTRTGRYDAIFAGGQEDEDGNEKLPFFKRGMDDYPGSRSLVDSE